MTSAAKLFICKIIGHDWSSVRRLGHPDEIYDVECRRCRLYVMGNRAMMKRIRALPQHWKW